MEQTLDLAKIWETYQQLAGDECAFRNTLLEALRDKYLFEYSRLYKQEIKKAEEFAQNYLSKLAENIFDICFFDKSIFSIRFEILRKQFDRLLPEYEFFVRGAGYQLFPLDREDILNEMAYEQVAYETEEFLAKLEKLPEFNTLTQRDGYGAQKKRLIRILLAKFKYA